MHTVEAIADEDISVYIINRDDFNKMSEAQPLLVKQLLLEFCKHLSSRLKDVTKEIQISRK